MCIIWTIKGLISLMHGITMKITMNISNIFENIINSYIPSGTLKGTVTTYHVTVCHSNTQCNPQNKRNVVLSFQRTRSDWAQP